MDLCKFSAPRPNVASKSKFKGCDPRVSASNLAREPLTNCIDECVSSAALELWSIYHRRSVRVMIELSKLVDLVESVASILLDKLMLRARIAKPGWVSKV